MPVLGLLLALGGLGFLCWLPFTLAIYALPVFVGLSVAAVAFKSGAGYGGACIIALVAGTATLALGRVVFASLRSPAMRGVIGLAYALPAAVAGYEATHALAGVGLASEGLRAVLAGAGGLAVGVAAWCRLSGFVVAPPEPSRAWIVRNAARGSERDVPAA